MRGGGIGMAGAGGTVGGRTMLPAGSNTSMKSSSSSEASWVSPTSVSSSGKRIQREMSELNVDPPPYCSAGPKGDNLYNWVATIIGPTGTSVQLGFGFAAPSECRDLYGDLLNDLSAAQVAFKTRIYHCNVDGVGTLSLDILKESWSPALTIAKVLLAIRSIFTNPDPYEPQVPDIARLYFSDRAKHDQVAAEWTLRFAR